jgi:hypothetical protein
MYVAGDNNRDGLKRLSPDVLNEISNYIPDAGMNLLDTRTRFAVGGRRMVYTVTLDTIDDIIRDVVNSIGIRGRKVTAMKLVLPEGFPLRLREEITPLYQAARVLAMHITFRPEDVKFTGTNGDVWSSRLALKDTFAALESFTPFLEELKLDFSALGDDFNDFESRYIPGKQDNVHRETETPKSKVGIGGCIEITTLQHILPALLTLSLELNGNEIGDIGLAMLTNLNHRTLKTLCLGLKNNNIGGESMQYLLGLGTNIDTGQTTPLEVLRIELEDNHIGDTGAAMLSGFGRFPGAIHTLHLGLQNNGIGDRGAGILISDLHGSEHFQRIQRIIGSAYHEIQRSVHLNLDNNPITTRVSDRPNGRNNTVKSWLDYFDGGMGMPLD